MEGLVNSICGKVDKASELPNGTNLNNVITSGFYRINESPVNAPTGSSYSQLIVTRSSDTIGQIIIQFSSAKMYVRSGYGINYDPHWTGWYKVNMTAV